MMMMSYMVRVVPINALQTIMLESYQKGNEERMADGANVSELRLRLLFSSSRLVCLFLYRLINVNKQKSGSLKSGQKDRGGRADHKGNFIVNSLRN
jgi:hypothetical protein